jgi:hypothetical protein
MSEPGSKLRRVGAMWKPKPDAKSKGSGELTINGMKQRFVVLPNRYKEPGTRQPDYVLMSGDEPEPDEYAGVRSTDAADERPIEDQIPF